MKYGPSFRGPCRKPESLLFHGKARHEQFGKQILYGENENIPRTAENYFRENLSKMIFPRVLFQISNFPTVVGKLTEISLKNNLSRISLIKVSIFFENFETMLVNLCFQFCSAAESKGQDGAILPDDQPIRLSEDKAGLLDIYHYSLMLSMIRTTVAISFLIYGIRDDQESRHMITAIQISFKLEKFKHFLGGNNKTAIWPTACPVSDLFGKGKGYWA